MSVSAETAKIVPRDRDGNPAADGTIGLVSISMSNATQEFSLFKQLADRDPQKSPRVAVVDCAQGGQAMAQWVDPNGRAWVEADQRLAAAGVSPKQVQVAWVKLANVRPTGDLPEHGAKLLVCAYGCLQRCIPLRDADTVTYCGLVVLTDLINATDRFIALN